jgi:hypothetical protein
MACALPVRERETIESPQMQTLCQAWNRLGVPEFMPAPESKDGAYAQALSISTRRDIKRVTLALLKKRKQGGRK